MLANGLRAVQVLLLAICALLVYGIVAPHLGATPALRDVRLASDEARAPDEVALEHYAVIWKQNPFRKPKKLQAEKPKKAKVPKVAEVSTLSWEIVTTAAATRPELSVAGIVNAKSGERRTVRVGDDVDGRKVVEIERRRVIFDHRGKLEQLEIAAAAPPRAARSKKARSTSRRPGARPSRPRLGKNRPRTQAAKPAPPRAAPPSASDLEGQFADQLELAEGERVVGVNGLPLDDPDLAAAANEGGPIVVQIENAAGETREVAVGPAQ